MTLNELTRFAKRYAEACCSQNPDGVAALYAEGGSLKVNDEPPAVGARCTRSKKSRRTC